MINNIMTTTKRNDNNIVIFNKNHEDHERITKLCFNKGFEITDYDYIILKDALDFLDESIEYYENENENYDLSEMNGDFIEGCCPVYNYDLKEWFNKTGSYYTDRAIEENEGNFNDTYELMRHGYILHMDKMFYIAIDIINYLK